MKRVFTLPPDQPFLDVLAQGLLKQSEADPSTLAAMRVFLPTRRACVALRDAFLRQAQGRSLLLPLMQPLGDMDEEELIFSQTAFASLPPPIAPLRRRLLLTRLVQARDGSLSIDQAALLADALAKFLDEAHIRRCSLQHLAGLVEQRELAQHWQETVRFLHILTEQWPTILAAEGCLDPADHRNRVVAAQLEAWRLTPPLTPVVAAGSTGSTPATADLLDAVAALPQGAVILPGLDTSMDEESWQEVESSHPQHAMKELLDKMGVKRHEVPQWGAQAFSSSPRLTLLREAMRPASTTQAWRNLDAGKMPASVRQGLSCVTFDHAQEEAQGVALMLRHALETPKQTVALITPDRALAERVIALLGRWHINANDSAGTSLADQPLGSFLTHLLRVAEPRAGGVAWLSLLKHPLTACGLSLAECRAYARQAETRFWRADTPETQGWLEAVQAKLRPLSEPWQQRRSFADWLDDHRDSAEIFASTDRESGAARLWQSAEGESALEWFDALRGAARDFTSLNGVDYAALFETLLRQVPYRPPYGQHPRLSVLGPLEARLLHPDLVVLGGMNEGVWPPAAPIDPWMSRPMRHDFGLVAPEQRIGLSAHDFVQLAAAPVVIMTRARRSGGAPTVPSRFLLQIETVLQAAGYGAEGKSILADALPWQEWARQLDRPDVVRPIPPPEPCPPVVVRPTQLSVTEIGLWQRNPYAIYAKHILKLRPLNALEAEWDAADRGNVIHEVLEDFIKRHASEWPSDALQKLLAIGRDHFTAFNARPDLLALWWPRFERMAAWFISEESQRRRNGTRPVAVEASGTVTLPDFTLKGRVDRLDRAADGSLIVIDYKTGGVPTKNEVESGLEPQLPLLAWMAQEGAFGVSVAQGVGQLAYWHMSGSGEGGKPIPFTDNLPDQITAAVDGLKCLIAAFADPCASYQAVPKPRLAPRYDDYRHLTRHAEWGR